MSDNTKYIFFVSVDTKGSAPRHQAVPGQTLTKQDGTKIPVDASQLVVQRTVKKNPEGMVFATDALTWKKDGYYVVGPVDVQVGDEKGNPIAPSAGMPKEQLEAIAQYVEFRDMAVNLTAKPKTNKTTLLDRLMGDKNFSPPTLEEHGFYIDKDTWYFLLRSVWKHKNILLTGPTGTGKTEMVEFVTDVLGVNCDVFDMAISNPTTSLCGSHRINENGVSEFQYARFANRIKHPGVKLLDEISRANPAANNVLLPLLDKRRTLYVEQAMGESEIKLHPEACVWATANLGMQYVGTMTLDSALMNRFQRVDITYPPKDMLIKVLQVRTKIDKPYATLLAELADKINTGGFSLGVSPRQLLEAGEAMYDGYSPEKALEFTVLNQYESDGVDGGERNRVKALVQQM